MTKAEMRRRIKEEIDPTFSGHWSHRQMKEILLIHETRSREFRRGNLRLAVDAECTRCYYVRKPKVD